MTVEIAADIVMTKSLSSKCKWIEIEIAIDLGI